MCQQTQQRRIEMAKASLATAELALYQSGNTMSEASEHTALRRAPYRVRADYLQAKCRLRQVLRGV